MSPEAEQVWKASDNYIVLAEKYLEPEDDRYSEGNAMWKKEEYRVTFLFPNWPERSRLDLCKVRCRFLGVGEAQRAERDQRSQGAASGAEHQEADAVAFQRDAQDACAGFSRIQQEILREKFFVQFEP
ncbi:MAG TPA: hypothetical protein VGR78_01960 [Verrucomicrobiae bacterium]|jgi:hypothetical protein|nr:hypothetical protein [Verrucomicrobiae bacterium]